MEKTTVKELVSRLEQELIRQGYKEATLNYYRTNWKRIAAYFDERGEEFFSEAVAMEYVYKKCDFFAKEKNGKLTQSNIYLFRIVRMMGDFAQHGVVLRRYMRSLSRVNNEFHKQCLDGFAKHCKAKEYSVSTQKSYRRTAENFLNFLEARSIPFETLNARTLTDFTKTLMGYSYKMALFVLCGTRAFLRFLHSGKHLAADLSEAVPCMQARKQTRIPSVWNDEDLTKIINAIDKGNPCGKRDYAIILLAARLGLRCIDIKRLTFGNFNWNENYLEFTQSKTKVPVRLPLLKDVGWARAYLPVLQAYLGHVQFSDTAYYLHLTADLFPNITEKVQTALGDIIPKAGCFDETD